MKTTEFNKPITSSRLRENFNKQFGSRINLENYDREQLEDIRNKLRTRIFQYEGSSKFNDLLKNESYQKDKAMLELLNTRIKEMLGEDIKKLRDKMVELSEGKKGVKVAKHPQGSKKATKDYDGDGKVEAPKDEVWGSRAKAAAKAGKPFEESAKPDFLDMDKDGDKKEPMKKAVKDKKVKEATKTDKPWTDMSGKKHSGTAVKGDKYTGKEAEKDEKSKNVKEAEEKCSECGMYENKCSCVHEGDMGKHNNKTTGFKALAKKAGGGEKGKKIAGAQFQKMKKAGQLEESNFKHNVRFVNESLSFLLNEDEEGKAKAITAAGDIVNDYTSWMQRVGQYQTKSMIELADAIRADFGAAESEAFKNAVGPALSATLEVLTQQREAVSNAVAALAGEAVPSEPMGMDPGMNPEPGMDMSAPDEMNPEPAGDEFGAADAAAGGAETAGRAMRESKFARKLAESHNIMAKLSR